MYIDRIKAVLQLMRTTVKRDFKQVTLKFAFIICFVMLFQMAFGPENSIVGVILTILMPSSMVRDLTAYPVKNFLREAALLVAMTLSAFLVNTLGPWASALVNFLMLLFILYAFTFEYATHLYVPYILSYLFLLFISPVSAGQLPKRLAGMIFGALCIMLYQMHMGRGRAGDAARGALTAMLDQARVCVQCLLSGTDTPDTPEEVRGNLCKLSRLIYDRRKYALRISDAGFAMLDAGRGLEQMILDLYAWEGPVTPARAAALKRTAAALDDFHAFICQDSGTLPALPSGAHNAAGREAAVLCERLRDIRAHLLHMADPEKKVTCRKTLQSFSVRVKAALGLSRVRVVYALRVAALLTVFTLVVQQMQLPHGKWLLFTLASVSLPYADDVGDKAKKRLIATLIGGLCAVAGFSLVSSPAGRTAFMMLAGYLTSYFTDYRFSFACSTVGGLGGAVMTSAYGWGPVGAMFLIRLGYICAGIVIALAANCLIAPFRRRTASQQLWNKYTAGTELLTRICQREDTDPQLYYSLIVQCHLAEEKLKENAASANWDGMQALLETCRARVRSAHQLRGPAEKV